MKGRRRQKVIGTLITHATFRRLFEAMAVDPVRAGKTQRPASAIRTLASSDADAAVYNLANLRQGAHTLGANTNLLGLALSIGQRCLLQIRAPHTISAALREADVVAERWPLAAHLTLSHNRATPT